jgi:hypothetical protein
MPRARLPLATKYSAFTTESTSKQWRHSVSETSGPSGVNRYSCPVEASSTTWLTRVDPAIGTLTAATSSRSTMPSSACPVSPPAR